MKLLALMHVLLGLASAEDLLLRDALGGAMVWRPYQGRVDWSGGKDREGFASGHGSLRIFDRTGQKTVAVITGTMRRGVISGNVQAHYPQSKDRSSYSGEYSDWSENGKGTMTFRGGAVVTGVWRDGEIVAELVDGIEAEHDADPGLQLRIDAAARSLQANYDNFKRSLAPVSAEYLTKCQRAWIKYDQGMLSLFRNQRFNDDDLRGNEMMLDELLTVQRTKEIVAISDWILRGDTKGLGFGINDPDAMQRVNRLVARVRETNGIDLASLDQTIKAWGEASEISSLIGLRKSDDPSTEVMIAAFLQLQISGFEQAMKTLLDGGNPMVEGVVAEPSLPEYPNSNRADPKELAGIVSGASSHWMDTGKAKGWPDELPKALADKVTAFSNPELAQIRAANDFLRTWKTDAAAAMASWPENQQAPHASPAITEWAKHLRESAGKNISEARKLREQAAERLSTGKCSLAASKIHEASAIAPSKGDSSALAVLQAYESLLKYSGGPEGQDLPIPPVETLDTCMDTSIRFRKAGAGELGAALEPYAKALRIAPVLREFSKISDPGQNLPQRPLKAYSELHKTSEWLSVSEDQDPRTKALSPILGNITASLGEKHGEYRKLVDEAAGLAAADKFSEAAKTYRKAFAIEESPEIADRIKTCESRISGL